MRKFIIFAQNVKHTTTPPNPTQEFPAKINTEFVQVLSPTHLKMKVWERGAGPTLACGTGACALTVAAILAGKTSERTVSWSERSWLMI